MASRGLSDIKRALRLEARPALEARRLGPGARTSESHSLVEAREERVALARLRAGDEPTPAGGVRQPLRRERLGDPELLPQPLRGGGHDGLDQDGEDPEDLRGGVE